MGNGTVQVKAHEVPRSVWSMLIIRTIDVLRKHMLPWLAMLIYLIFSWILAMRSSSQVTRTSARSW